MDAPYSGVTEWLVMVVKNERQAQETGFCFIFEKESMNIMKKKTKTVGLNIQTIAIQKYIFLGNINYVQKKTKKKNQQHKTPYFKFRLSTV